MDVLRAVAILLVLGRHAHWPEKTVLGDLWHTGGWIGVDLFFVLSGFLVSRVLFLEFAERQQINVRRFLLRRAWRIYPAFWMFILVSAILFASVPDIHWRVATELLFLQSYSRSRLWAHTWSLSIEEAFYIFLPLLLCGLRKENLKSLNWIVPATVVALLLARCINAIVPYDHQTHVFAAHLRFDSLMVGTLLAYHYQFSPSFVRWCTKHSNWLCCGILLALPSFFFTLESSPFIYTIGFTLNAFGCGALLMGMVCGGIHSNPLSRGLAKIGKLSYSIYLWHALALLILVPAIGLRGWPALYAYFAISIAFGACMAKVIEEPSLWLRDRLAVAKGTDSGPVAGVAA